MRRRVLRERIAKLRICVQQLASGCFPRLGIAFWFGRVFSFGDRRGDFNREKTTDNSRLV
jgi:hypothetical protein